MPSNPFTLDGIQQVNGANSKEIQDRVYGGFSDKINQQYGRDNEALRTQLVNQGINVGNEAYSRATSDLNTNRDNALRDAYTASLNEGRNDLTMQQNMRQNQISDRMLERSQPYNELSAFLQGAPALNNPQQVSAGQYQVGAAPIYESTQAGYQGALNNYNQKVGTRNAGMGAAGGLIGSLGSAAIMMSSRTFKTDNTPIDNSDILTKLDSLPIEKWRYTDGETQHIGCYAEDFKEAFNLGDGKTISVVDAVGVLMASVQALYQQNKQLLKMVAAHG